MVGEKRLYMLNNILKISPNNINNILNILSQESIKGKILFITDKRVNELYGAVVKKQLEELGRVKIEFIDNNSIKYSMFMAEEIIATDIDYVVGLGGGRVLDVCKYAAYISKKPFISIPTTMANDGIASPVAVLKMDDNRPKSLGCIMPYAIIIDTVLIEKSPIGLIKAGIGDTISNYMALLDWEIACKNSKDTMNDFAYLMSKTALDSMMRTEYKEICPRFINVLADSLILSGLAMNFAGSSRPVSGSEHLFSHALDYYCKSNNLHGIQVALGTVSMLNLLDMDSKPVIDYLNRFKVDINPLSLNITKDDFVLCMQKAPSMRESRYTYFNQIDLDKVKLEKLYDKLTEEL